MGALLPRDPHLQASVLPRQLNLCQQRSSLNGNGGPRGGGERTGPALPAHQGWRRLSSLARCHHQGLSCCPPGLGSFPTLLLRVGAAPLPLPLPTPAPGARRKLRPSLHCVVRARLGSRVGGRSPACHCGTLGRSCPPGASFSHQHYVGRYRMRSPGAGLTRGGGEWKCGRPLNPLPPALTPGETPQVGSVLEPCGPGPQPRGDTGTVLALSCLGCQPWRCGGPSA